MRAHFNFFLTCKFLSFQSDDSDDSGSAVVELTDSNFQQKLGQKEGPWLVEFFAPWCGHCKSLKPHWEKAAKELKGKVHLGALDATVHKMMASRYEVRGFPTIKFFPSGEERKELQNVNSAENV